VHGASAVRVAEIAPVRCRLRTVRRRCYDSSVFENCRITGHERSMPPYSKTNGCRHFVRAFPNFRRRGPRWQHAPRSRGPSSAIYPMVRLMRFYGTICRRASCPRIDHPSWTTADRFRFGRFLAPFYEQRSPTNGLFENHANSFRFEPITIL